MNISDIIKASQRPEIYAQGTAVMWTDEYISQQLLSVHLNPDVDLASRKPATINKTIDWILDKCPKQKMNILDLGCGPGLYTERLAMKGHNVTGMDFSKSSIEYARKHSDENQLNIQYRNQNYLELSDKDMYDLVILIYTDFGVLSPFDRDTLTNKILRSLKPGGLFIFDVMNDKQLEKKVTGKTWETAVSGFWRSTPFIALSDSFLYKKEKVILYQHIIIEDNKHDIYRFYTHYFSNIDLSMELSRNGFAIKGFFEDVLPGNDLWNGNNVTFCVAEKPTA